MMMWMWTCLLTSLALAQPLLNEVGDDGVPEMLRAGPELPEITEDHKPLILMLLFKWWVVLTQRFSLKDKITLMSLCSVQRCDSTGDEMDPVKIRQSIEAIHMRQGTLPIFELKGFVSRHWHSRMVFVSWLQSKKSQSFAL